MSQPVAHPYRPKWWAVLLLLTLSAGAAAGLGVTAWGNTQGLNFTREFGLGPAAATAFYWAAGGIAGLFAVYTAAVAVRSVGGSQRLTLGPDVLTVPALWAGGAHVIPYRDIRGLSVVTVNGRRMLEVSHAGGSVTIQAACLPSAAAFDEVCSGLAARRR